MQFTHRVALAEREVAGHTFARGEGIVILTAAANRDPAVYADPERLDITRFAGRSPAPRHLSFSEGLHYCLGAHLGRLETQLAVDALLRRSPALRLAGEPGWRDTVAIHGLDTLPVRLRTYRPSTGVRTQASQGRRMSAHETAAAQPAAAQPAIAQPNAAPHAYAPKVVFDVFDPEHWPDPYPRYAVARAARPLFPRTPLGVHLVTRYLRDCCRVFCRTIHLEPRARRRKLFSIPGVDATDLPRLVPLDGPARPHPAARAGQQGVHPAHGWPLYAPASNGSSGTCSTRSSRPASLARLARQT